MEVNCRTLGWSSLQELQINKQISFFRSLILRSLGQTMWFARGFTYENEVATTTTKNATKQPYIPRNLLSRKLEPFIACQAANMHPCSALWDFISQSMTLIVILFVSLSLSISSTDMCIANKNSNKNGTKHQITLSFCVILFLEICQEHQSEINCFLLKIMYWCFKVQILG